MSENNIGQTVVGPDGDQKKIRMFIGSQKVKSFEEIQDAKTPGGGIIVKVTYDTNHIEIMPDKRFDLVRTFKESDETKAKERLVKEVGSGIYGYLHEYGVKMGEIEAIFSNISLLVNNASNKANDLLWGVKHSDERTLLQINEVLMKNYKVNEHPDQQTTNNDGTPPGGSVVDSANPQ